MTERILKNPYRGRGLPPDPKRAEGSVSDDIARTEALFSLCPVKEETPLVDAPLVAKLFGIDALRLKDERHRMGLGSFKALGATYAIANLAQASVEDGGDMQSALSGTTFVCASAGNHGLSMAAGARLFGANAVVYLAETVPETFADRLRQKGAEVVREGADYEASMTAAEHAAVAKGWTLLSDGSWSGYTSWPRQVMEGYLIFGAEMARQMATPPTHLMLQAGVGGLAAAGAVAARKFWGDAVTITVVEPVAAPALLESIAAGRVVETAGPVSTMGRLDCKTPSHLALDALARDADFFATISDVRVAETVDLLVKHDLATTPSGAAGIAALHHRTLYADQLEIGPDARVAAILSEAA